MTQQGFFNGFRQDFSASDVDFVSRSATQINEPVRNLGQVAGMKNSRAKGRRGLGPIGLADNVAMHLQATVGGDLALDVAERNTGAGAVHSHAAGSIVSNAATLAGAVEVVNL